jgi:Tol biopolymer transport system component
MNADPELKQRLSRAADPLELDVEGRLRSLHRSAPRRRLVHKAGVIAVAASVAVLGAVAAIRLAPATRVPGVGPVDPGTPQGQIAYTGGSAALELSLFTVSASGGSDPIAVPSDAPYAQVERWSPDGTKIAYLAPDGAPSNDLSIVVANEDGSDAHTIVPGQYLWVSWSPDGRKIAYVGIQGLWIVNADGTGPRLIDNGRWESVDWSPDGTKLLLSGYPTDTNQLDLYTMTPQGRDLTQLTNDGASEHVASWSPDGSSIVFGLSPGSADDDHQMNVAVASASGADVRVLTDWSGFDGFPVWPPDGRWIAFASDRDATQAQIDANATSGVDTGFSLYTMSSDGSEVTMIVDAGDRAILPTSWKA